MLTGGARARGQTPLTACRRSVADLLMGAAVSHGAPKEGRPGLALLPALGHTSPVPGDFSCSGGLCVTEASFGSPEG